MGVSNGTTALGIAVALGEIPMPKAEEICQQPRSLFLGRLLLLRRRTDPGADRAARQQARRRRPLSHRPCGDEGRARYRRHLRRHPQCRPRVAGATARRRPQGRARQLLHEMRGGPPRHAARPAPDHAGRFRRPSPPPFQGGGRRRGGGGDRRSGRVRVGRRHASGPAWRRPVHRDRRCWTNRRPARSLLEYGRLPASHAPGGGHQRGRQER